MKTYHSAAYPIDKTRGLRGEFFVIFKPSYLVSPLRLELKTYGLEGRCSILLSYGDI